jgi:hypothetical protein
VCEFLFASCFCWNLLDYFECISELKSELTGDVPSLATREFLFAFCFYSKLLGNFRGHFRVERRTRRRCSESCRVRASVRFLLQFELACTGGFPSHGFALVNNVNAAPTFLDTFVQEAPADEPVA